MPGPKQANKIILHFNFFKRVAAEFIVIFSRLEILIFVNLNDFNSAPKCFRCNA